MDLATATHYAKQIVSWLQPHCELMQIAGSIRRGKPQCADIDIVCIPKTTEITDLLGATEQRINHCHAYLQGYVRDRNPLSSPARRPWFQSGGDIDGKQCILQLPKCQLDLWFATPENFATRLLCRTGSKEHNTWLATRFAERGMHWFIYEGVANLSDLKGIDLEAHGAADKALAAGAILGRKDASPSPGGEGRGEGGISSPRGDIFSESDLYALAGLKAIEPKNREIDYLRKHIDSGLTV